MDKLATRKNKIYIGLTVLGLCAVLVVGVIRKLSLQPDSRPGVQTIPQPKDAFSRADRSRKITFPGDRGPHPDFRSEWWYYTGNLITPENQLFGYQLTFFRRALLAPDKIIDRSSRWATSQVYMGHFAITDVTRNQHLEYEKYSRGSPGHANAQAQPFEVYLDNWEVSEISPGVFRLRAEQDGIALDLTLVETKAPTLQGENGYSQKGSAPDQASHYYSVTRIETNGTITVNGQALAVEGLSWMDHEFSTSYVSNDQVGWDWFSIQLDDNSELMLFQMRNADKNLEPHSEAAFINPDGVLTKINPNEYKIVILNYWKSPETGAIYPSEWRLSIPDLDLVLDITPSIPDQEMNLSAIYWEGAVELRGTKAGRPISGKGFVEMTGYKIPFAGEF